VAFRRLGAEVLVVSQARPERVAAFLREQPLPFPVAADPDRVAYRAFGLERTSWAAVLRPGVVLRYLRFLFRGWRPRPVGPGEDVLQLGGDFVLDGQGRLAYAYRSAEPTDRPTLEALLQAVRQASPATTPGRARARGDENRERG
jgi:peroxiredoxin